MVVVVVVAVVVVVGLFVTCCWSADIIYSFLARVVRLVAPTVKEVVSLPCAEALVATKLKLSLDFLTNCHYFLILDAILGA